MDGRCDNYFQNNFICICDFLLALVEVCAYKSANAVLSLLQHVTSSVEVGTKTVKRYVAPVKDFVEFVMQNVSCLYLLTLSQ